jgi:hypothetical protein
MMMTTPAPLDGGGRLRPNIPTVSSPAAPAAASLPPLAATNSGDVQGTFRERSGKIHGTFMERSGNQGTFREHPASIASAL